MDQTLCGRANCGKSAAKFCINCGAMLCSTHRIVDVEDNQVCGAPQHLHVDPNHYQDFYCNIHREMLTGRCINCGVFSCNKCPPEICPKGSGRHHDYDAVSDYGRRYKVEISELEKLLQKKNDTFQLLLKEACRALEKTDRDLQQIMDKVDKEVKNQITALTDYGKKFKGEIYNKKIDLTTPIVQQIKVLEQKEMETRNLLASIQACIKDISGIKLIKTFSEIKKEAEVLLQDRVHISQPPVYELFFTGVDQSQPLQLELRQTSPGLEAECEAIMPPKQKDTEIKYLKTHKADQQKFLRVSYRPTSAQDTVEGSAVIAGNWHYTERVQEGESADGKQHKLEVHQLLPYEDEMLLLTGESDADTWSYTVRGRDSCRVFCTFYHRYYNYPEKRVAVTSTRQLIVLHRESQTLHIMSMEAEEETKQRLSDIGIKGACGIVVTSGGSIIITCESRERDRLLHYDHQALKVLWESEPLPGRRLRVTQFQESVYVIQFKRPTHVWRLSMADGCLVQTILCNGLPEQVWDMSMRGDTFVVAGGDDGICFFQIKDVL